MLKPLVLFALLGLFSCNTPTQRLADLHHEFLINLANQDYFEVKTPKETYFLPLPTMQSPPGQRAVAELLQKEANVVAKMALSAEQRLQLDIIRRALADFLSSSGHAFGDPGRFVVGDLLQKAQSQSQDGLLLEKIPAYYTEVEKRWQIPSVPRAAKALEKARAALEMLHKMERSGAAAERIERAQYALKDFIGLCQSAQLTK